MAKHLALILIAILALFTKQAQAQDMDTINDFAPRRSVIFQDDFSDDSLGDFPAGWRICVCNGDKYAFDTSHCFIAKTPQGNAAVIRFDTAFITNIEPSIEPNKYLPDSFTLEFDFLLGSSKTSMDVGLNLMSNACFGEGFSLYNKDNKGYIITHEAFYLLTGETEGHDKWTAALPPGFDPSRLHHFALAFYKRSIKCFLDKERIMSIPDCHYSPNSFSLSCSIDDAVKYWNVRLASGMAPSHFDRIITEQKLITYAIHFDIDSSTIKPESIGFITQLAAWMKANPKVLLEIDGHTDNDGNPDKNLQLSQTRADEVMKQLTLLGINANRLTAKGYGATKPIQTNDTPEGKAANRRVEFVKQ